MLDLPARANLAQVHHLAKDLLQAAKQGDPNSLDRIRVVSDRVILASAQLTVAREYGFPSWSMLKTEVKRREILTNRDVSQLTGLLSAEPQLAATMMVRWCDHSKGVRPLNYVAMLRFEHERMGLPSDPRGTGAVAKKLIAAGAPVDGYPDDPETPLITAASYGDVEVARVLIDAGADFEVRAASNAGGVPGGTALLHAAVFGMTDVLDLLVQAGASVHGIEEAAASGNIAGWLTTMTPLQPRIRALVMAADHQRLGVIDQLIAAGTPIDAVDEHYGLQALRVAAQNGRPASVRRLLEHGADPNLRDPEHQRTALEWSRREHRNLEGPGHDEVEAILRSVTKQ